MADYDLGTARGRIVIDYDDRGSKRSQEDMAETERRSGLLSSAFSRLKASLTSSNAGTATSINQVNDAGSKLSRQIPVLQSLIGRYGQLGGSSSKAAQQAQRAAQTVRNAQDNLALAEARASRAADQHQASLRALNAVMSRTNPSASAIAAAQDKVAASSRRLATAHDTVRRATTNLSSANNKLRGISGIFGTLRSGISISSSLARAILGLGAAFGALQGIIGIVAGVVGAIKQLSGVLGLLPGLAFAGASSIATLGIGLLGVGDAFKAMGKSAKGGGGGAASGAKKAADSANQVADAQRALEDAYRQADRTARDGAEQVRAAREGLADAIVDANRAIAASEKALFRSNRDLIEAQKELNEARKQAVKDLRALRLELSGAIVDEKGASLALTQAKEAMDLAIARGDPTADMRSMAQATSEASQKLEEAKQRTVDLKEQTNEYATKGLQANDGLVAAQNRVRDAAEAVADAELDLRNTRVDSAKQVAAAQRSLAQAQTSAAEANADAQRSIADAVRNLSRAYQSAQDSAAGASGGTDAFADALAKLSPNARAFVLAVKALKPAFDDMKLSVQDKLFAGLADHVRILGAIYMPILKKGLGGIATSMNGVVKRISEWLQQEDTIKDFGKGFDLTRQIIDNLSKAVKPLLRAFMDVAIVGLKVFKDLTAGVGKTATGFSDFIRKTRKSGDLEKWIRNGVQAVKDLFAIVRNLAQIFSAFFKGFGEDGKGFLATLRSATATLRDFLQSAKGQSALKGFADTMRAVSQVSREVFGAAIEELGPILKDITPFVKQLATVVGTVLVAAIKILGPILDGIAKTLSFLGPVITPIIGFFLAMGIASKVLLLVLGKFGPLLKLLTLGFTSVKNIIGVLIAPVAALGRVWGGLLGAFNKVKGVTGPIGTAFSAIGRGASSAASAVGSAATSFGSAVARYATSAWNAAISTGKAFGSMVLSGGQKTVNAISSAATSFGTVVATYASKAWTAAAGVARAFGSMVVTASTTLISGITSAATTFGTAIAGFATKAWAAATSVGSAFLSMATKAWTATAGVIRAIGVQIAQWTLLAVQAMAKALIIAAAWLIANPWVLIAAAIIAIVILIIANWDKVKAFLTNVWDGIKSVAENVWGAISDFFKMIGNAIVGAVRWCFVTLPNIVRDGLNAAATWCYNRLRDIGNFFKNMGNNVVAAVKWCFTTLPQLVLKGINTAVSWLGRGISNMVSAVGRGVSNVLHWFGGLPGWIGQKLANIGSWLWNAGKDLLNGLLNGIKSLGNAIWDWIKGLLDDVWQGVKNFFGIGSPSKEMHWIGEMIGQGLADGLKKSTKSVARAADTLNAAASIAPISNAVDVSARYGLSDASRAGIQRAASMAAATGSTNGSSTTDIRTGNITVSIPVEDLDQIKDVNDFFNRIIPTARAGSVSGS